MAVAVGETVAQVEPAGAKQRYVVSFGCISVWGSKQTNRKQNKEDNTKNVRRRNNCVLKSLEGFRFIDLGPGSINKHPTYKTKKRAKGEVYGVCSRM